MPNRAGLVVVLVGGPLLFTLSWLLLGWSQPGYSQRADSISVLAAYGAPLAAVMTAAFLGQAVAMAAAGWALRRVAPAAGVLLAVNAVATVVLTVARIPCRAGDATWCTPSEHPTSYAVHVVAATVALVALSLAPAVAAARLRRTGWVWSGAAATGLMVPLLAWFAVATAAGWAEKAVVTVGIGWAAAIASGLIVRPDRHADRTSNQEVPR